MKRFLIIVCALSVLFCACKRENSQPTIGEVSDAVIGALSGSENFTLADDDYAESNFNIDEETDDERIYIDEGREIGIFRLEDGGNATVAEQGIRAYLEGEKSSLASLASLYPSEALAEKLQRYQNATIVKKGRYICYLILDETETTAAQMAFGGAFR